MRFNSFSVSMCKHQKQQFHWSDCAISSIWFYNCIGLDNNKPQISRYLELVETLGLENMKELLAQGHLQNPGEEHWSIFFEKFIGIFFPLEWKKFSSVLCGFLLYLSGLRSAWKLHTCSHEKLPVLNNCSQIFVGIIFLLRGKRFIGAVHGFLPLLDKEQQWEWKTFKGGSNYMYSG